MNNDMENITQEVATTYTVPSVMKEHIDFLRTQFEMRDNVWKEESQRREDQIQKLQDINIKLRAALSFTLAHLVAYEERMKVEGIADFTMADDRWDDYMTLAETT